AQQLADYIRSVDGSQSQAAPASSPNQAPAPQPSQPSGFDNFLRQTALTGRAAAQGVVGALTLPDTVFQGEMNLGAKGINKLLGTNLQTDYPNLSERFSNALTSAGAPVPETGGEQLGSTAVSGLT